ncbi:unnamed protein product, partial [Brachionus calyciflorus]
NVTQIFTRIAIDLVLGLDESEEGYIGILVIIEFLTNFPYAKPMKSKSAKEIADILIEYISIFGPFSDQGKEFLNQIMKELKNNLGFEHIVTSAYNPRTNGKTERFNQTLIESLRKHSEADNLRKLSILENQSIESNSKTCNFFFKILQIIEV